MKQDKTSSNTGLRALVDELLSRAAKLNSSAAGAGGEFQARVRVVGPPNAGGNLSVPTTDGPSAVMLTLPPLTVPVGSKVNISGVMLIGNAVNFPRQAQVMVEIVPGVAIGDMLEAGTCNFAASAAGTILLPIPYSVDYTTTLPTTTFVITVIDATAGASNGDLVCHTMTSFAVALRVG